MSTAAPRLRLSFQTGIITAEDGLQLIPTFNPVEGSRHHTHTRAGASHVSPLSERFEDEERPQPPSLRASGGGATG